MRAVFQISLLLVASCSPEPTARLEREPSDDAIRLALRHQAAGILPDMELAAVYDDVLARGALATPASRCTRVEADFNNRIDIVVDQELAQIWRGGERTTGNIALDTLVADYHLTITPRAEPLVQEFFLDIDTQALIRGERDDFAAAAIGVRTDRLAALLADVEGVIRAAPVDFFYDGPNIEVSEPDPETWELLYDHGWGDCPSGCINHRYWRTLVPKDTALAAVMAESFGTPDDVDDPERAQRLREYLAGACGGL